MIVGADTAEAELENLGRNNCVVSDLFCVFLCLFVAKKKSPQLPDRQHSVLLRRPGYTAIRLNVAHSPQP